MDKRLFQDLHSVPPHEPKLEKRVETEAPLGDFERDYARYVEAKMRLARVFDEGRDLVRGLSEQGIDARWRAEVIPRIDEAKKQVREAGEALSEALQIYQEQRKDESISPGLYTVRVNFMKRGDTQETMRLGRMTVSDKYPKHVSDLSQYARGEIQSIGLHNFGLKGDEIGFALVAYEIVNEQQAGAVIKGKCLVEGGSGHLVNRETLRRNDHWQ